MIKGSMVVMLFLLSVGKTQTLPTPSPEEMRQKRLSAMDETKATGNGPHLEIINNDKGVVVADCQKDSATQAEVKAGTKVMFHGCTLTYILY